MQYTVYLSFVCQNQQMLEIQTVPSAGNLHRHHGRRSSDSLSSHRGPCWRAAVLHPPTRGRASCWLLIEVVVCDAAVEHTLQSRWYIINLQCVQDSGPFQQGNQVTGCQRAHKLGDKKTKKSVFWQQRSGPRMRLEERPVVDSVSRCIGHPGGRIDLPEVLCSKWSSFVSVWQHRYSFVVCFLLNTIILAFLCSVWLILIECNLTHTVNTYLPSISRNG